MAKVKATKQTLAERILALEIKNDLHDRIINDLADSFGQLVQGLIDHKIIVAKSDDDQLKSN